MASSPLGGLDTPVYFWDGDQHNVAKPVDLPKFYVHCLKGMFLGAVG
jgi:hypothetical protein